MAELTQLRRHIEALRRLDGMAARAASDVARAVRADVLERVARGVGPDGKPWPETEDGHPPLQHAARSLTVRAVGNVVVATLRGAAARHSLGEVRGRVKRPILPAGTLPASLVRRVRAVLEREFRQTMEAR